MDRQVVTSRRKLNLRRDLPLLALGGQTDSQEHVSRKKKTF